LRFVPPLGARGTNCEVCEFGIWSFDCAQDDKIGICDLEFGIWNLEFGIWDLAIRLTPSAGWIEDVAVNQIMSQLPPSPISPFSPLDLN